MPRTLPKYFILTSASDGYWLDNQYRTTINQTWRCSHCTHIKPGIREIDVQIRERRIPDPPLASSDLLFPRAVLKEFLFQLPIEIIERDLYLGKIYGPDGKLNEKWVTMHGRYVLQVEGERPLPQQDNCPLCGYKYPFGFGGKEFLTTPPPEDAEIFEGNGAELIVPDYLLEKLNVSKWKRKLYVEELPIHPVKKS